MLEQLFPRSNQRYLSLPLLGPILDGYDDWLSDKKYTRLTRRMYMRMAAHLDRYLREDDLNNLRQLSADNLEVLWARHHVNVPNARSLGGAIQTIRSYLDAKGLLLPASPKSMSSFDAYLEGYEAYLLRVRGFVTGTIHDHLVTTKKLLAFLFGDQQAPVFTELDISKIEDFVTQSTKGYGRGTVQHEVAHVRAFLRYLAMKGEIPAGLDEQIDTPRAFRPRPPLRSFPWDCRSLYQQYQPEYADGHTRLCHVFTGHLLWFATLRDRGSYT